MRLLNRSVYAGCIVLGLLGCAAPKKTTSTTQSAKYSEDLSALRPKPEATSTALSTPVTDKDGRKPTTNVEPKYAVNRKLDPVLDSINSTNRQRNYVDGFTIQVYSGLKREDALNAKKELTTYLPGVSSEVQYAQPNFRVKVGKYLNRMDAQKDYTDVKKYFPTAIVIPDKVSIN